MENYLGDNFRNRLCLCQVLGSAWQWRALLQFLESQEHTGLS